VQIGIDYTSAVYQGAGIGRLTRHVVQALAALDQANQSPEQPFADQYTLLVQGRSLPGMPTVGRPARPVNVASQIPNRNWREVRTPLNERWWTRIWHRFRVPFRVEWLMGDLDLFHGPDFVLPPLSPSTRAVVTIHDLSFIHFPHCFEPALLKYLNAAVPRSARRADWILADSENTRRDVIELLDVPGHKIAVLYPGVEPRFGPLVDKGILSTVRAKYDLPQDFVLAVGTVQPRKNYVRLVEAVNRLDADVHLVIGGGRGWLYQELLDRIQALDLADRVHLIGYVADEDLPALYNLAQAFAQPSLYEGFGIPILEAMACGVPVVAADNSSLPEAAGDAGLLVDAEDSEALAHALYRALSDSQQRGRMIDRGRAWASQFTWQRAAEALYNTYHHVGET
jgi:glycosyltransferase involved in cell wall biosynthesis